MLKDKKITIMTLIEGENEVGDTVLIDAPIPGGENIWAYYRQASGVEFTEASKINTKIDAVFIINWRNDIDEAMKIKFRNELYNITRIDVFEGYKTDLKIYAYKVN